MKTVSLTDAKNQLPRLVNGLVEGPIVLTRNGKPCAALVGLDEKLDREALALGRNKRLRELINDACREAQEKGAIPFAKVLAKVQGRMRRRDSRRSNS